MEKKYQLIQKDGYWIAKNEGGRVIGVADPAMLIEADGYAFKDFDHSGVMEPFKDWRLPLEERISDLVGRIKIEEIAGLMAYSIQESVLKNDPFAAFGHYGSSPQNDDGNVWDLSENLKHLIIDQKMRHITLAMCESVEAAARWSNNLQALAEAQPLGLPVNVATDPRNAVAIKLAEFTMGASDYLSTWPDNLGMAATFSPELAKEYGEVASKEYRAMGITTTLAPQVDLASDPRWNRFYGTFGESSRLSADMARAYCDGFQTSDGSDVIEHGWGMGSVSTMVKHWPGGGAGEGGRDAHFAFGKYAVYPGKNFGEHLLPFTEGAFRLDGPTGTASAVMPYYSISYGQDPSGENVGNAYSKYIITDLLRKKHGFEGVVCTDWGVVGDPGESIDTIMCGKSWGVEKLTSTERHYKLIQAGVDQLGGCNDVGPILEAYRVGVQEHGKETMDARFRESARRILRCIFRLGLMENPYLDAAESEAVVKSESHHKKGAAAQKKSIVMLKNQGAVLPLRRGTKVYVPKKIKPASIDWFGQTVPAQEYDAIAPALYQGRFSFTDNPEEAEAAFVFMDSPSGPAYKNGYVPINLQYRPHTSGKSRENSIAEDRSILGKTGCTDNEADLDCLLKTRLLMGDKPVIVFLTAQNPTVMKELEPVADAIVVEFGIEKQHLLALAVGEFEPSGLLPCQMPADMDAVDAQREDVPMDMTPYTDGCGHRYDFAFGMNWSGVIRDDRVAKYGRNNGTPAEE